MRKAFYLKVNRYDDASIRNLEKWVDIAYFSGNDFYVISDREVINDIIRNRFVFENIKIIPSDYSDKAKDIVEKCISAPAWHKAAYAHLTTFLHAKKQGYKRFWNIDADDTRVCLSVDRTLEILSKAEEYAETNNINCFSLDMWRTRTKGKHWSFGITYTNGELDWENILLSKGEQRENLDWCFTELKESFPELGIETFYFENLKFIHYADDMFSKVVNSGFYHWKNGKLDFPLISVCMEMPDHGKLEIFKDVIKLECGIDSNESNKNIYLETVDLKIRDMIFLKNERNQILIEKIEKYKSNRIGDKKLVYWGAGEYFLQYSSLIKLIGGDNTVDNNPDKWDKEIIEGINCISPNTFEQDKIENVFVILVVQSNNAKEQVIKQLKNMGVTGYDTIEHVERILGDAFEVE